MFIYLFIYSFMSDSTQRRESGGRELVRPITLYREDGSLAEGWDRLSPVTEVRGSALE
jgi:hypothetical protein